jgi:ribokinase
VNVRSPSPVAKRRHGVRPLSADVVVVGGLNLDLVVQVPELPRPGETVAGGSLAMHPGGKGANQAVAAARLGASTAMIGRVGADDFGHRLRAALDAAGVSIACVRDDPNEPTGVALIGVEPSGQNSIVVAAGANLRVSPDDVAAGCAVVLNAAPATELPPELLRAIDLLVANEVEAATLLRGRLPAEPGEAALALLKLGGRSAILTLGERGLWVATAGQLEHVPAFGVRAVDTTAAGDAFLGGLAAAHVRGVDLAEACRYGAAAAALAVTRPGAQPSLPGAAEVDAMLDRRT